MNEFKRGYFVYLKEARRLGEHSIDGAAAALAKFEDYTRFRDFKKFHIQQAIGFKNRLAEHISPRTGERLSRGTVFSTLNALRGFFQWLSTQPGYRSHLSSADAEYFALSEREARIAKAIAERPVPTIDQIRHVLQTMPAGTDIELRNRAVVAFTVLTGARDGAIASLKCKHVDVVEGKVVQEWRDGQWKKSGYAGEAEVECGEVGRGGGGGGGGGGVGGRVRWRRGWGGGVGGRGGGVGERRGGAQAGAGDEVGRGRRGREGGLSRAREGWGRLRCRGRGGETRRGRRDI